MEVRKGLALIPRAADEYTLGIIGQIPIAIQIQKEAPAALIPNKGHGLPRARSPQQQAAIYILPGQHWLLGERSGLNAGADRTRNEHLICLLVVEVRCIGGGKLSDSRLRRCRTRRELRWKAQSEPGEEHQRDRRPPDDESPQAFRRIGA